MIGTFKGYPEISILNPQMRYFQKNVNYTFFKNGDFGGVRPRKLSLNKIGVMDMSYIMDSGKNSLYTTFPNIFFIIIGRFGRFINKPKKSYFWKKCKFFNQKSAVEGPKRVLQGHHDSPRSALTFPTNPQIWFLNF